ncbi:MAG: PAS domain S-box protein [Desulfobacteria bacterium]
MMEQLEAINVGIVGGGRGCKAVIEMILARKLKRLRMKIVGVADLYQDAVGYRYAQEQGIYTTTDYRDLYRLKDLHMIIELTAREEVANEIPRTKPKHVRFMDHVAARLFWDIFQIEEDSIAERKRAEEALHKMSEEQALLLDNIDTQVWYLTDLENHGAVNKALAEFLGVQKSDVANKNIHNIFSEEEAEVCIAGNREVFESKTKVRTEEWVKNGEGELCLLSITKTPKLDEDRNIEYVVCAAEDITERKRAEEAALESERKYRLAVDNANDAIFVVQDGVVKFPNPKVREITGYSADYLAATPFADLIGPEDRDMVVERHKKRLNGEDVPNTYSFRIINRAGEQLWVEVNAVLITWEAKPAVLCFLRDMTRQKKLEAQLQYSRKIEAVGTLAGGVAHDFNNLLMGIQGNVSLMQMGIDQAHPDYERLKNIEKQIQSGARLTSHLLGYARKGKYEVIPLDLNRLVEDTSDTFGRTKKQITIHRELAKDLFAVEADSTQIEQVLLNLCVNAADAMPGGGDMTLKTTNVTHKDMKGKLYEPKPGSYVLLAVTDTGTGMYKKTMERIFDPFFTTKEMGRGTGLGLASAYGIIKGHGGYIDADSTRGRGTTFSIYLPASKKKVRQVAKTEERLVKGTGTVLLVDDEEVILEVGRELLEALGYRVLLAQDGKEAVKVYGKNQDKIDIVVLDVVMPGMGGGEAYDRMKDINPDIKVLLSSGFSIDGEASKILERGCNGFIQKPFTMKELSGEIGKILKRG